MEERTVPHSSDHQFLSESPLYTHREQFEVQPARCWQVRLEFRELAGQVREFDLRDAVEIGTTGDSAYNIDLSPFAARAAGVSRRHACLEPTAEGIRITDLGSTNGTCINGRPISARLPHQLYDGDVVMLGSLEFAVRIKSIEGGEEVSAQQIELADALAIMAKAITSQLDLEQILSRALEHAIKLTSAREAAIWLVDEATDELFLEAESGLEDETIRRLRLPVTDSQAGQVVATGLPLRVSRTAGGEQVKVKTGYMVEAVLYVPLIHGATTFGVMSVVHRETGKVFGIRDEKLLASLADFAAVALHNSRVYQQLASAHRIQREMIQNISHEFRTPLTYVVGYTGLMLDLDDLPAEIMEGLEVIQQQATKLNRMVENFVSIETSKRDAQHRETVDVHSLIEILLRNNKLLAREKNISLVMQVDDVLPEVAINSLAITQVLDNLMGNALKFTPEGGTITVSAQQASEYEVVVSVADSGIGIPQDVQDRIFDRFYQVDGSATRKYGGVGLGLSVCKSIVEAHNGQIWVDSEPDQGTRFAFTLPIA